MKRLFSAFLLLATSSTGLAEANACSPAPAPHLIFIPYTTEPRDKEWFEQVMTNFSGHGRARHDGKLTVFYMASPNNAQQEELGRLRAQFIADELERRGAVRRAMMMESSATSTRSVAALDPDPKTVDDLVQLFRPFTGC